MTTIDFIIPSFNTPELTYAAISSFEKFKKTHNFRYIIVENSNSEAGRDKLLRDFSNLVWIQNPTNLRGSDAVAIAFERGMEIVEAKYVFMCHNDVMACSESWMDYFISKIEDGCSLVGAMQDAGRIKAVRQSGLLVESEIARSVSLYPVHNNDGVQILDVGDSLTKFCRDNSLNYFVCNNTFNSPELVDLIKEEKYKNMHIDRAFDNDGNVIFMHLGRGTRKHSGNYFKPERPGCGPRVTYSQWLALATNIQDKLLK